VLSKFILEIDPGRVFPIAVESVETAVYMSVDMVDKPLKNMVLLYIAVEKYCIVDGREFIMGPPEVMRVDMESTQRVPPIPSVTSI
jgi:hypothetical protein